MPLTIRDDASMASYVIQNSVTTWQAYNLWGDYSLYYGPTRPGGQTFANRARVVSFDRPYPQTWASGAADFVGNELPAAHAPREPRARPHLLDRRRPARPARSSSPTTAASSAWATTSTGPSRCARPPTRPSPTASTWPSSAPTPCYRQIRMEPTLGRARTAWRSATRARRRTRWRRSEPSLTTVNWAQAPVDDPESTLIGSMYQSVGAKADMVVTDSSSWFYDGCNLTDGHAFPNMILGEYDRYVPSLPGPAERRRAGPLPRPRAGQLVRRHLLHGTRQRGRGAGRRLGQLRRPDLDDRRHPRPSWSPGPSRASPT